MSKKLPITPGLFLAIQYQPFFDLLPELGITERVPEWEDPLREYALLLTPSLTGSMLRQVATTLCHGVKKIRSLTERRRPRRHQRLTAIFL
jgi:hypothetical protein